MAFEDTVVNLEKKGKIGFAFSFFTLLILTGFNSYLHNDAGTGLIFFLIVVAVAVSPPEWAADFMGTTALALLVTLHTALFGANPLAILLSLVAFFLFRAWMSSIFLIPIWAYLAFDAILLYIKPYYDVKVLFTSVGDYLFSNPLFYSFASILPLTYLYLLIERRTKKYFKSDLWQEQGSCFLIGMIPCTLLPFSLLFEGFIARHLVLLAGWSILLQMSGFLTVSRRNRERFKWIAYSPMIILAIEAVVFNWPKIVDKALHP